MKNVLFLTYYFPPAGGSAVQRTLKFAKYLPEYGWRPIVLTAETGSFVLHDESLLQEIPEPVRVERTPAPDLYSVFSRFRRGKGGGADLAALADPGSEGSFFLHAALFIRSCLFIPDARIGWFPHAVRKGMNLIRDRKNPVDVIFASAPPFTTLAAGMYLAKRSGLPFVIDYRDPWTGAYFYFKRPFAAARFEEFLERQCIRSASRIVSINRRIVDGMPGHVDESRVHIIPNGFDPADFEHISPYRDSSRFTIVYTGTQHARMNARPLIQAAELAAEHSPDLAEHLLIRCIGRTSDDVKRMLKRSKLAATIELEGHMDHRKCLDHAAGADLLLLLIPRGPGSELIVTGKLFEYLKSGRHVLCLAEQGDACRIIQRAKAGTCIHPDNLQETAGFLVQQFNRWKKGQSMQTAQADQSYIESFSRRKATGDLARIFDSLYRAGRNPEQRP